MSAKYQKNWERVWAAWLGLVALSFALLEGVALVKREDGDTLSENTRRWIRTEHTWRSWGALGFVAGLVGFVVWFLPHIVFRAW